MTINLIAVDRFNIEMSANNIGPIHIYHKYKRTCIMIDDNEYWTTVWLDYCRIIALSKYYDITHRKAKCEYLSFRVDLAINNCISMIPALPV